MTVYSDGEHLIATSLPELHAFAQSIGLKREWYQDRRIAHYDLTTARMITKAHRAGAISVSSRELVRLTRRRRKRKWVYIQEPPIYGITCDECDGSNITWSEWEQLIWCYDCQIDTEGSGGIFDGPIAKGACKILGMSLDRIDLRTGERLTMKIEDDKVVYEPTNTNT